MSETIHRKKFMNGTISPADVHRKFAWANKPCGGCGKAPVMRALSFAPFDELNARAPEYLAATALQNDGKVPIVEFTYGKFVRIGEALACADCRKALEVEAARSPSYVLVELQELPKDVVLSQVPA